jgi:biopolymer transport protein ExbB/TolQ
MNQSAMIRPGWSPATIALMVLGFIVFWPLGLAMLAYIIFGDRLRGFRTNTEGASKWFANCRRASRNYTAPFSTGNVAFDDWRKAELDRLEEERRKLDEMRQDFDTYMSELRRAKDQEEFDRFMRDRKNRSSGDQSVVDL